MPDHVGHDNRKGIALPGPAGNPIPIKQKKHNNTMETKSKAMYEAPATEVVEVKFEGVICQSNTSEIPGWGDANEL